jgi:hypothetical protein
VCSPWFGSRLRKTGRAAAAPNERLSWSALLGYATFASLCSPICLHADYLDCINCQGAWMTDSVATIDALKLRLNATNDSDLARKLAVDKRTVSAWRARGSVPDRYKAIIDGESHQTVWTPPLKWGPYEEAAFRLALFRYTRVKAKAAASNDFRTAFDEFAHPRGFWLLVNRCQKDLAAAMEDRTDHVQTALALVIHDDIASGAASIERDRLSLDWRGNTD